MLSIFHNIFKSIQNFTKIFLDFFQCYLKIENNVMILNLKIAYGVKG